MSSDKKALLLPLIALLASILASCQAGPGRADGPSTKSGSELAAVREQEYAGLDFGQDWVTTDPGGPAAPPPLGSLGGPGGRTKPSAPAATGRGSYWTIVVGTFPAGGGTPPATAAANMIRDISSLDARLGSAHVETTEHGAMVVFGVYGTPTDEEAKRDLAWIKGIQLSGRPLFPGAVMTRIRHERAADYSNPYALLSLRRQFPKVDPLYSLQVAVWGDFGSGKLSVKEIERRAEAYTTQLRRQGFEAYFYHDEDLHLSMVTVGRFDRTAMDPQTGILSPEVEALMEKFPAHLVNGQPLMEPDDPNQPSGKTHVQRPRLVLVPK